MCPNRFIGLPISLVLFEMCEGKKYSIFLTLSRSLHFCGLKTENIINNYYWVNTLLFYYSLRYTIHDPINTESMPHWGVSPKAKRVRTLDPILQLRRAVPPRVDVLKETCGHVFGASRVGGWQNLSGFL